jgi:hypothetical protein
MTEKTKRIVGMLVCWVAFVFAFWYVNYNYGYRGDFELVGFGTNPMGYDSVVYKAVLEPLNAAHPYRYSASNFFWIVTQILPLIGAWLIRRQLGEAAGFVERLLHKAYRAV